VLRSWISSFNKSPLARALGENYYKVYSPVVERQYARSQIRIACMSDEPGAIVCFAVLEPERSTVHFVCVREKWRRKGVASLLLANELKQTGIQYTHSAPPYIRAPHVWSYMPLSGAFS
jgi:GNAT superfamily N-acetyltransferase